MEDSKQNNACDTGLRSLPRSIRWRIQLELIKDCDGENVEQAGLTERGWNEHKDNKYLEDLALRNESIIMDQRTGYEKLTEKHYRQSSALAIINDTEINSPLDGRVPGPGTSGKSSRAARKKVVPKMMAKNPVKNVVDDPLSLMASMEEQKMKVDRQKEIDRKRELIMASRPHMLYHPATVKTTTNTNASKDDLDSDFKSNTESMTKTRWDDFYSSKDTIDLIEKDLDRMPIDHHIFFHQRKTKEMISVDDEDWNADNPITMQSRKERSKILSEILFVYAKEHSIGYRQGMHEILSFLLMAIEIDLLGLERSQSQPQRDGTITESLYSPAVKRCLLNQSTLIHDTYCMFDAVMSSLASSFEYGGENPQATHGRESIGDATMTIIKEWYGNDELADFVSTLDAPPELYCTRWIRLMFSREVSGIQNVFCLWDEFFQQVSNSMSLMNVLETTAASMIILIQDKLIPTPAAMAYQDGSMYYQSYDNGFDGIDDGEHEPMHLLMNYPRMDDITQLVEIFQKLMASQRSGSKPSKVQMAHQSQAHMNNYMPQQIFPNEQPRRIPPPVNEPVVADTMYYSRGPVNYDPPQPVVDQTQQFMNNAMQHQDQLMATLKNLKAGPALAKLSSGLNAVKGALQSIDLQSIDNPLKPPESSHRPPDNIYRPSPPIAAMKEDNMTVAPNETFLGYRDLSTLPAIFDEQMSVPKHNVVKAPDDFATEGSFVGGGNTFISQQPFEESIPSIPTQHLDTTDVVSHEIAGRMKRSISKIAAHLQNQSGNSSNSSSANDAWIALTELETIQRELTTLYQISLKQHSFLNNK